MDWQQQRFQSAEEATEAALAALDAEERKLADLERTMAEETTTVRAKGRQLSMTFDGRGELTGVTFHGTRYRSIAPAELAHVLVETFREGRAQSMAKLNSFMGSSMLPNVDFTQQHDGAWGNDNMGSHFASGYVPGANQAKENFQTAGSNDQADNVMVLQPNCRAMGRVDGPAGTVAV
jgi:hypothetical protein